MGASGTQNRQNGLQKSVIVIGGGPAGLTAAYLLSRQGVPVTVLEADPEYVGGISRTVNYKGFHFDIGGHRFFSKSKEVEDLWTEILPDDLLGRPRSSKIYYLNKFFAYPLKPFEALFKLGPFEALRCVVSYIHRRLSPVKNPRNFQEWVTNQFGKRLFDIFFKTYTEKVWGMKCTDISADWAAQRIKGLSLKAAILNAIMPKKKVRGQGKVIKTLIDHFRYPRKGPGMMWAACAEKTIAGGGKILMGHQAVGCQYDSLRQLWTVTFKDQRGQTHSQCATDVISSAPMKELCKGIQPKMSPEALIAADSLKYRDFLVIALIVKHKKAEPFSDNWIYIHDPSVSVGRIQNFKSWSEEMVPDPQFSCYGMEYFCFEGDGMWTSSDDALIEKAKNEIQKVGLAHRDEIIDASVVRQKKAYPVYDDHYQEHVNTIKNELDARFPGLHLVGRNGMHKYNNQDHAMMTAMLCVKNILSEEKRYDLWKVNEDAEYHEELIQMPQSKMVPKKAA